MYSLSQQDMQRQLEKVTELVRLIVQKLEIPADMEIDDSSKSDKNESWIRFQKFHQTFNIARRFSHVQSTTSDNSSHEFHHPTS